MNLLGDASRRLIVFVAPRPSGESLRGASAVAQLDSVSLLGICEHLPNPVDASVFADLVRVKDTHDPLQLIDAARRFASRHGDLERIVTVHETLLAPVAQANEAIGLTGMSLSTVRGTLDKSLLKQALQDVGIETTRDQVVTGRDQAARFVEDVGYPVVLKPLGGSGGLVTWRVHHPVELEQALDLLQPTTSEAVFIENHLKGQELCIDTITVANEPRFYSICRYHPNILEALEDARIQWRCVMPRDITGDAYRDFIAQGLAAVRALKVGNAMTHMEGFLLDEGRVSFTDATLRPAGARIAPMLAFAYDIDPYRAWARVAVDGCFDGPWERKYAVGTIFLRGEGQGCVKHIEGIQAVQKRLAGLLVDTRLPRVGVPKSVTYTGDGYITVRHPDTNVVEDALDTIAETVVLTYDDETPESSSQGVHDAWSQRLLHFNQRRYKPVWDEDALPGANEAPG